MTARIDELIRALSDPTIYPHRPRSVQVVQTHISVIFIAGELVYKIKKPLDFGFLNFTTLEKRRYYCNQEVKLNSRFSENIYLKVLSITADEDGPNLDGRGEEIEVAVLMRRIPHERIMINMLEQDQVTPDILNRLADRIAYFHSQAHRGPQITSFGSTEVIYQNLKENFEQTTRYVGLTIDQGAHSEISALAYDFLSTHAHLFRQRMSGGFIRDCHGDLHLDHVVILNGIILYDCIEFNDRFRFGDTAADLGFLLMDLDYRGYPAYARQIAQRYAESSGDHQILKLLGFYKAYRAFVRGKVLGFALDEPEIAEPEKIVAVDEARNYYRLSLACLERPGPPILIVMSGLTGTGKSYLSERLGKRLGIEPLRSDVARKQIQGLSSLEHQLDNYGTGIYTPKSTELTYKALFERARRSLELGESVIIDASFMSFRRRMQAKELAAKERARFMIVECVAPERVIQTRLENRAKDRTEPSDGRWEIFLHQRTDFEPICDDERDYHRSWDSTGELNPFLTSLVRELTFHWLEPTDSSR